MEQSTQQQFDNWVYRIVVGLLDFVCITVVIGAIIISIIAEGKLANILTTLGLAAIGTFSGILSPLLATQ